MSGSGSAPHEKESSDEFMAEILRRRAATQTLSNIEQSCVGGIPEEFRFVAANAVIEAYLSGCVQTSPVASSEDG